MSLCDQRKSSDDNPSGKFKHIATPGVQQFSPLAYKGLRFAVGRRTVGVTVKRAQYSVSILAEEGRTLKYLDNFSTMQSAQQAARDWIDRALYHTKLEKTRDQAREMREAKLRESILSRAS